MTEKSSNSKSTSKSQKVASIFESLKPSKLKSSKKSSSEQENLLDIDQYGCVNNDEESISDKLDNACTLEESKEFEYFLTLPPDNTFRRHSYTPSILVTSGNNSSSDCSPKSFSPIMSNNPFRDDSLSLIYSKPLSKRVEELRNIPKSSLKSSLAKSKNKTDQNSTRRVSFLVTSAIPEEASEFSSDVFEQNENVKGLKEDESSAVIEDRTTNDENNKANENIKAISFGDYWYSRNDMEGKSEIEFPSSQLTTDNHGHGKTNQLYTELISPKRPTDLLFQPLFMGSRKASSPSTNHYFGGRRGSLVQNPPTGFDEMGFTGKGDLGLITTSGSSSLLALNPQITELTQVPVLSAERKSAPQVKVSITTPTGNSSSFKKSPESGFPIENDVGVPDLTEIHPLSDHLLLNNLMIRHKRDCIYTYLGTDLVSINPYKRIPIYTSEMIYLYHNSPPYYLPPHMYSLTNAVHKGVYERHEDHVVIPIGVSGSGKTEVVKLVLQYLAAVSPEASSDVRQILLQSNPILEAFGNARTALNDNSSRFMKYMDIELDFQGNPVGGAISCYLLEKFRVTTVNSGERNFHIFYQILAGADLPILKTLRLRRNASHYRILEGTLHNLANDALEDRDEFVITKRALDVIGFIQEEQMNVLKVVAAVLKLGNLSFIPINNIDGSEGCAVENEYELQEICEILHCETNILSTALQSRTVEVRSQEVTMELSAAEAAVNRNTLCRSMYARFFTWIVGRLNTAFKVKSRGKRKILALLDIFGFESINSNNGFQQLVINYCNEKLHQVLTSLSMKEKQEEYLKEGLDWRHIEYSTNYSIIEIIEMSKNGVMAIIDDVSTERPVGGAYEEYDKQILHRFKTDCHPHPNFETQSSEQNCSDDELTENVFRIRHFVKPVTYDVRGLVKKNTDSITNDIKLAMYKCGHPIIKAIFPEGNPEKPLLKRPSSSLTQTRVALGAIVRAIRSKVVGTVYCLKPNQLKQPRNEDQALLNQQIKSLGLIERTRLANEGWVIGDPHNSFLERYKMVSVHTWPHWGGPSLDGCAILLAGLPIPPTQYTFGKCKVFIKSVKALNILEQYRRDRLMELAVKIQTLWRAHWQRNRFKSMRNAQITISSSWRKWKAFTSNSVSGDKQFGLCKGFKMYLLAKEELRDIKHKKRLNWGALTIQMAYVKYQRYKLLRQLIQEPPSESPTNCDWPDAPFIVREASENLKKLHYKWKCGEHRKRFDQTGRNRMREKVTASILFKDRKASYFRSISHPFVGDYVRLRQNVQWRRMSSESNDQFVVFADMVHKIARSSGKFVPTLLAISTNSLLILDQRTLQIKYRIPATDIESISLSPYMDDIAVIHVKAPNPALAPPVGLESLNPGCLFGAQEELRRKGDLILQTGHVIELVTKTFLVCQNATSQPPEIVVASSFEVNLGPSTIWFSFKIGTGECAPGQIKIHKRHNRMEVYL